MLFRAVVGELFPLLYVDTRRQRSNCNMNVILCKLIYRAEAKQFEAEKKHLLNQLSQRDTETEELNRRYRIHCVGFVVSLPAVVSICML